MRSGYGITTALHKMQEVYAAMHHLDPIQENAQEKVSSTYYSLRPFLKIISKLEELEEETIRLRQKLDRVATTPTSLDRPRTGTLPAPIGSAHQSTYLPPQVDFIPTPSSTAQTQSIAVYREPNLSGTSGPYPLDRTIDGLRVDSQTIVDTFSLYDSISILNM
jgi:hypothetical protein